MKIAIVGAGWYGCHLALFLQQIGFEVTVFEKSDSVFSGASGYNQNRLHQGFHYARDYMTRLQSRDGFSRFLERYPRLSMELTNNLYAIPRGDSLIDFRTYKAIMASSGVEFEELRAEDNALLENVSGLIRANERIVATGQAASFFEEKLRSILVLDRRITIDMIEQDETSVRVGGERFDYLIDATWGKLTPIGFQVYYEPTVLLYYKSKLQDWALTLVDGPLCSIYPTDEPGMVTLSSVVHTPLGYFDNPATAENCLRSLSAATVHEKRQLMERQVAKYLPDFKSLFEYVGPQLSMKTKPTGAEDNRACYVINNNRLFTVMSGKIDTIFVAAERVISAIGQPR